MRVLVIGGGIAGLSAAIALRTVGLDAVVYERAPERLEVGAGISLWANAMRALDRLGAGEAVRQRSLRMVRSEMRVDNGRRVLMVVDAPPVERRFGLPELVRMIHRSELLETLAAQLPASVVRYGYECVAVDGGEERPTVRFRNGERVQADVVVGADGIHSVIRTAIAGAAAPRYAGYTCWRGVCRRPAAVEPGYMGEWWGCGRRLGITAIPEDRVYWFAVENAPPAAQFADDRAHLLAAFAGWAEPGPSLLASTPAASIIRNDILDRPPASVWSKGHVAVVGDAAHAATPNLGQGGCLAIEDAVVLARELATAEKPAEALLAFTAARSPRTSAIVRESWRLGRIAQQDGRIACAMRDAAIGWMAKLASPARFLKHARFDVGPLPPGPCASTSMTVE